ncbi:autotransporter domain-containing protein [Sebaldella sp. S0638]|uniref:autotransporter domain-containing protein n=1 Tax=Sebaldella sp. S0638 TaxID=2957809 RepID=UPI0020A0530D|nr:autotransporter domain-containing protein [Sebaldella sp. S0638]MCP1222978.1 autotransporter domain-containing protein [Sebaldella sp. S0638]
MKNKNFLMFFLAVNAFAVSQGAADSINRSEKYEKLYNGMIQNIEAGKSNVKNYDVLEKILEKRNKELKDLYLQSDYIVKPEYLEWQIFFSGFYAHRESGDNTLANGTYHSDPSNVNGKFYTALGEAKQVDLGLYIPERTIKRNPVELKLVNPPEINLNSLDVNPEVNPSVSPSASSGSYKEFTPTGSMKSFLAAYENLFESATYTTEKSDGATLLIVAANSYKVNYNVNTGLDITVNTVIDSFSNNKSFANGDSEVIWGTNSISTSYGSTASNPAFYGGGTRVIGVFGGAGNVTNSNEMDLKGPFSYGMVAEGGRSTLTNNSSGVISDDKENDTADTWYNNEIPHIGETITYTQEKSTTDPGTIITDPSRTTTVDKHPDGNIIYVNGRPVYRHGGTADSPDVSSTVTTIGLIDYKRTTTVRSYLGGYLGYKVGMFVNSNLTPSDTTIQNDGTIRFNGYSSIGMYTSAGNGLSDIQMRNNGTIDINTGNYTGYSNFGMKLDGTVTNDATKKVILNNDIISISNGAGIAVVNGSTGEGFVENSSTGKITVANGTGIYLAPLSTSSKVEDAVNNGTITVTNGAGMYAVGGRDEITRVINNGTISVTTGMGMVAAGKNSEAVNNSKDFIIGASTGGFYATKGGKVINTANLTVNSSGVSLFNIDGDSEGNSTGNIEMTKDSSVAFYNKGKFTSAGDIKIDGNNSIAVYSDGTNNTNIKADTISLSGTKGAVFYTNGGKINISPNTGTKTTVTVSGDSSYLFYDSSFKTGSLPNQTFVINGDLDADVQTGAIAFDFKNVSGSLLNYVENNLLDVQSGITTINIGGTAFHAKNSTISIDEVSKIQTGLGTGSVKLVGSDIFYAEKSIINIDKDSDLDLTTDTYQKNQSHIANSSINLAAGNSISGSKNGQYGIGQENYDNTSVTLKNEGDIILTGSGTTGIYGNNTEILNIGNITTGDSSTGIFSSNNAKTVNTGNINFGNSGIGIYGINTYGSTVPSTYNKIDITMSAGTLTADGTTEAYGIFANNSKGDGYSNVNFSGGLIDLSKISAMDRNKAVAVAVKDTDLKSAGDINTAENGIVFYINGGNTNISGGTINLDKDNSIGLALQNIQPTKFTGTGAAFNIDGDGIILFHLKDSTGIKDDFIVNVASGSNYRYADMKNSSFTFDRAFNIEDNINFIVADASAVLLGTNSDINSTGTGNIGVYAKNKAAASVTGSLGVSNEVTNSGKIRLEDSSTGIYAEDGAGVLNDVSGIINVGDSSQGIYAKNSGSIVNRGDINTGESSIGIYFNNASAAENYGKIMSSSDNAVGVYMDNQTAGFRNDGTITLSGQNNIGIYDTGTGIRTIENNGKITVGDSLSADSPNVGIYSTDGSLTINHNVNAEINSGVNSMGIYAKNTTINIKGNIKTGDNGTGIYADSGSYVNISSSAKLNLGALNAAGVYALGGTVIDNYSSDIVYPSDSYAFVLNSGAVLNNHAASVTLDNGKVFAYSDNAVINNNGNFALTGTDNIVLYGVNNSAVTNTGIIDAGGTQGSNIGIYAKDSNITNSGKIIMGDSVIVDEYNPFVNKYSVAIYGENSNIRNDTGSDVSVGENSAGLYGVGGTIVNSGKITSTKDGAIGVFIDNGTAENKGLIELYGANSVGLAGKTGSTLTNSGTIKIHGDNSIGIFANLGSFVINTGTIEVLGNNSTGIHLQGKSVLLNEGTIILGSGLSDSVKVSYSTGYDIPEIQNAGIIKVAEKFEVPADFQISIKPAASSFREPTASEIFSDNYALEDIDGRYLISNAVSFVAPYFAATEPVVVLPDFSQHTNALAYKLEDVFVPTTPDGGPNSGKVRVKSKSITWDVIPNENADGNIDLWMVKIPYNVYTYGLWYDGFGKSLDANYAGANAEGIEIFDKIDYIDNEKDLRHIMASLGGNVYSNINQREEDIAEVFENSLGLLQNSHNNTKENVKINVIAGKGNRKEKTDGVVEYDSSYTGIMALREVERTYRHTFGYSAGYLHSGFEFKDGNESEEWVDTLQFGMHSKYKADNWELRNDLTARGSIHNVDRNIDWPSPNSRSEMNGTYETYSLTSDNRLGKEFGIGKNTSVTPYGGIKAMYVVRPTFEEEGLERLKVEGNDAWSVKPRAGVELKASVPMGKNSAWKVKGTLDLAYEYELANLNERERAQLVAAEDGYHDLAKPEEEKGQFKTRASIGVEVEERYGVFLTGEYVAGEKSQEEYRAGVTLKAVF